jgi:hypothetical protein
MKKRILVTGGVCVKGYKTKIMKECKDNLCMKEISADMVYNSIKSDKLL